MDAQQLGGLVALHQEIVDRVLKGKLDPVFVIRQIRKYILQGQRLFADAFTQVERQLNKLSELGVSISKKKWNNILQQAEDFKQLSDTDFPLVTGGFHFNDPRILLNNLFETLMKSHGYDTHDFIKNHEIEYVPGMEPSGGLRIVHYDAYSYMGRTHEETLELAKRDGIRLAGAEVLEFMILNPGDCLTWDGRLYHSWAMRGLRELRGQWSYVPTVFGLSGKPSLGVFIVDPNDESQIDYSPIIREC